MSSERGTVTTKGMDTGMWWWLGLRLREGGLTRESGMSGWGNQQKLQLEEVALEFSGNEGRLRF